MTWWKRRRQPWDAISEESHLRGVEVFGELRDAALLDVTDMMAAGMTDQEIIANLAEAFLTGSRHPGTVMSLAFSHALLWLARNPCRCGVAS